MSQNNQEKLGNILWDIANQLRGSMNADQFRDYMLSFLFLYYISIKYREAVEKELGSEYDKDSETPILDWYGNNPNDVEEFEKQMRKKIHYVINPKYLWDNLRKLAKANKDATVKQEKDDEDNNNHNINEEDNSLKIIKKRVLMYPEQIDAYCPICNKVFKFRKGEDDIFHRIIKRTKKEE